MSTRVAIDPKAAFPIGDDDFAGYFLDGCKPRQRFRVGAEFEKFAVEPDSGRPIRYDEPGGLRDLMQTLADRFGWEPHYEGEHLTTLSRQGATVSLEPGGQVEFATSAVATIHEIASQLETHRQEICAAAPHMAFVAAGVHPFAATADIPLGVRPRHRMMAEYLPRVAPRALDMMKATASTQATFDYDSETDATRKFTVALMLAPIVNALWANSAIVAGRVSDDHSARARIWLGMDPARSGVLPDLLSRGVSFANYTGYLLDVPKLFQFVHGEFRPAQGSTFRDFLRNGIDGLHPTLADWELHLTTVFPEARLKHFLEVRGADANPPRLALAVPAFWKGLFYDDAALDGAMSLCNLIRTEDLPTLIEDATRHGLAAVLHGESLRDWNRRLVALARSGLRSQGVPGEDDYLDPLDEILDTGQTPSLRSRNSSIHDWLAQSAY